MFLNRIMQTLVYCKQIFACDTTLQAFWECFMLCISPLMFFLFVSIQGLYYENAVES